MGILFEKMIVNQKEIVLLPYPFSDQEGSKVRPAIAISSNDFNKKCQDCIMVPLTTVIKDEPFSILINQNNLESGNLLKQSRIRLDKIFSINKNLIITKIGRINNKSFEKIKEDLITIF